VPELTPPVQLEVERHRKVSILVLHGVLDTCTYRRVRDSIIKAALDEPRAVIVDVNDLCVPVNSAWTVCTSARWHVSTWPDVPILLVCAQPERRLTIAGLGVTRFVPVHPTRVAALASVAAQVSHGRRRARAQLPASGACIGLGRRLIADWLKAWGQSRLIPIAGTVATVFIENVLAHTDCARLLLVESYKTPSPLFWRTTAPSRQAGTKTPTMAPKCFLGWHLCRHSVVPGVVLRPPRVRRCGRSSAAKTS
jgi:hypothetical protein